MKKDKLISEGIIDIQNLKNLQAEVKDCIISQSPSIELFRVSIMILPQKLTPSDICEDIFNEGLIYSNISVSEDCYYGSILSSAQKVYITMLSFSNNQLLENYCKDFEIYKRMQERGILKILQVYPKPFKQYYNFLYIIERNDASSLAWELAARKRMNNYFTETELFTYFSQLIYIFSVYHENGIYHGCICPLCIGISSKIYVINIGIQLRNIEGFLSDCKINNPEEKIPYFSPEVMKLYISYQKNQRILNVNYFNSDVFSLGLIFLHMASLKAPLGLNDTSNSLEKRIEDCVNELNYSEQLKILIKLMLIITDNNRPSLSELNENMKKPLE